MAKVRLQKYIAASGVTSRRKAETLISEGMVSVNGKKVKQLGTLINPQLDRIIVSNQIISEQAPIYYAFHKPLKVVTTMADTQGRPCIGDYCKNIPQRVFPIGRLDTDSTGLLLLSNDGDFAQNIMHPRHTIGKTYLVTVLGIVSPSICLKLSRGIRLREGITAPSEVTIVGFAQSGKTTTLTVTIYQGWNRQIRRMFGSVGHPVLTLKRSAIGTIQLKDLKQGHIRRLSKNEISSITIV